MHSLITASRASMMPRAIPNGRTISANCFGTNDEYCEISHRSEGLGRKWMFR